MIQLIIKKSGLFLDIPGINPFRTPACVDITKANLHTVTSELKKNGIDKYEIVSGEKISIPKKIVEKKEVLKDKKNEILEKIKIQQESISKIEGMLNKILKSSNNGLEDKKIENLLENFLQSDEKTIKSKIVNEEIDEFIPSINLGNLKIKKGNSN